MKRHLVIALVMLTLVAAGVVVRAVLGSDDHDRAKADQEPSEAPAVDEQGVLRMPTYRLRLPDGWHLGIDDDPMDEDGVGFRAGEDFRVHGSFYRNPAAETAARGEPASPRERIAEIKEGHAGLANVLAVGRVERLEFDIDGEEAWRTEMRYGNEVPGQPDSFRMLWVAFEHDGQEYLVTFEGREPVADQDAAAFEELLRSWEFT